MSIMLFDFEVDEQKYDFSYDIDNALARAENELNIISSQLDESLQTISRLTPECDKTDYILAACSGALCGIMDIFLVGKPGESPAGQVSDKWFENRVKDFAKLCGWNPKKNGDSFSSALICIEKKFKIPYDQTGTKMAGGKVFGLSPDNHHFKSLGHNGIFLILQ